jgi:hypothetical protein
MAWRGIRAVPGKGDSPVVELVGEGVDFVGVCDLFEADLPAILSQFLP